MIQIRINLKNVEKHKKFRNPVIQAMGEIALRHGAGRTEQGRPCQEVRFAPGPWVTQKLNILNLPRICCWR
jgi:hypothetical protein